MTEKEAGPWGACPECNLKMTEPFPHHSLDCWVTRCGHMVVRATEPIEYPYFWTKYRP